MSEQVVSLMRPKKGWKAVHDSRKEVDSHEALLAAWKCDVMTGCSEPIRLESNHATECRKSTTGKKTQKRAGLMLSRWLLPGPPEPGL
ncbi:hypothetical protein KEM52_004841 [Ascosphaera acerosa]|nr:hypothetical protein KEM52_004841 [Ascosphaera acerosa]